MRPKSVVHAERVYLFAIALLAVGAVIAWPETVAAVGAALAGGTTALVVGLMLLLLLLTTRRASRVAMGLLVAITAIGIGSLFYQVGTGTIAFGVVGIVNTGETVLTAIGAVLLLRPNARVWFAEEHRGWQEDA